ncbi:probable E3 ubiquitin-protein ligase RHB1A [Daucus carota subsp. sativus]|uniref:probable E3 ubiquitin-protein ligase RHB1A n=1 Tax=Daucus carota subsp. sativus TaxID=79200 RepID=UPI0007F02CA7|nr:PREDICTED: probable E3 ubiquitin-protein ligase RHB1A [Daucus carota subsp. sativus]XP_017219875.1 PREDICTED: probable E3 ubiquitin-protein ligase RHB1A [Daucus carota subsp. sativus]
MGVCCSSTKNNQLHGTPIYYYCSPAVEEHRSLTSHDGAAVARTTGFIVDLNLDTSSPDTFQRPPTPIPFDVLGYPQTIDSNFAGLIISGSSLHKGTYLSHKELDCKVQVGDLASPTKLGVELSKLNEVDAPKTEEEDVCPTCFEDYDVENPKIITKCNHHFHLSCILEWMERSDTCPICDQEMDFEVS